ncbi:hypothetical protein Leucomu_08765 [Leucobacter muris]|uniref:Uncharacterized protein n=1 Tax=Leucobacter muris TaxID=1935379 RepID=A0ABX5QG47_9MICO|nr:hypothetical protein [Leucobacter muris]QAB17996.1 hypothetical protein Leucomu_08765 [Leucobacter muris]
MSEQDEQRPLTRRERRLREMEETGALDLSEISEATAAPKPASAPQPEGEVEISPYREDGTPRSRREMRELREQALAERAARAQSESDPGAAAVAEQPAGAEGAAVNADDVRPSVAEQPAQPTAPAEPAPIDEPAAQRKPAPVGERREDGAPEAAETPAEPVPAPIPAVRPAPSAEPTSSPAEPTSSPAEEIEAAPVVEGPADDDVPETVEAEIVSEQLGQDPAPAEETGALDFDTLIAPPTEPFTVAELQDAEAGTPDDAEDEDDAHAEAEAPAEIVDEAEAESAPAPKPKRRFPWQRKAAAEETPADEAPVEAPAEESLTHEAPAEAAAADPEPGVDGAPPAEAQAPVPEEPVEANIETDAEMAGARPAVSDPVAVDEAIAVAEIAEPREAPVDELVEPSPEQKTSYSFPDIAPPEEWRSVFDDPTSRKVPDQGGQGGDFDDLISRAVAQESTSTTAGTSALILPSMPEDTGGLAGPIGTTGELYVTGSLKLPKSLGETGGHSALHDSIEMDPITGEESGDVRMTSEGPAPVSARHAVSARAASGLPVAKPVKDRSKLPLVLSLTGGGLLVAVVALGVWGASNGMFG